MENKNYTTEDLNNLVIEEAKKLKDNTTLEERYQLNFSTLKTKKRDSCIYGQMTGDCFSERAIELIEASCEKVFNRIKDENNVRKICGELNGSPKGKPRTNSWSPVYWSPIEIFIDEEINQTNGNNERLVDYLKGNTDTLILE